MMPTEIEKIIFGNIESIGKPLRWYHWLNVILKILTPTSCIILYILKMYEISFLFYLMFLVDSFMFLFFAKKYKEHKEYHDLMKLAEIPKNRWDR